MSEPVCCAPPPPGVFGFRRGWSRWVLLVGPLALKVPSPASLWGFLRGVVGNRHEARRSGLAPRLCPVLWAMPGGLLLVMLRAKPLTAEQVHGLPADFAETPFGPMPDPDPRNFGWLDGHPVIVDYGW